VTTTAASVPDRVDLPEPPGNDPAEARRRGDTKIEARVVEKIAARAAADVPGAHAARATGPRSLLPVSSSPRTVDAKIGGTAVRLEVHIDAEWPASVVTLALRARDEVRATVLALTGLDLQAFDITVEHVVQPDRPPRPRVR